MKKQRIRQLAVLCALTALMQAGLAQARDYLVEVVLFENLAGRELTAGGLYYPKVGRSFWLGSEEASAAGYLPIESGLSLTENAQSIGNSRNYRVLRHMAWRQPGLPEKDAVAIRISTGQSSQLFIPQKIGSYREFIPASASPVPGMEREIKTSTLSGSIKVHLGRFLHMQALLVYTDAETGQSFRLSQSRKMRSRELHYIDNPRFGILTRILPVEESAGNADSDSAEQQREVDESGQAVTQETDEAVSQE